MVLPFEDLCRLTTAPLKKQLLKWIGNKQRFAAEIVSYFPEQFDTYYEPFLGSGAVLATLAPARAVATDSFWPLVGIWKTLRNQPETLVTWYSERWNRMAEGERVAEYESIKSSYNSDPNPADLLFLCRACYGGVVRFRQADGYMSTPCGVHLPISPRSFAGRVAEWHVRVQGAMFQQMEYETAMDMARVSDLVYCDPPYTYSQAILYGAQAFSLENLFATIRRCKERGVYVALSIDGTKRSGRLDCALPIPKGLFEREVFVECGPSMLKRFQMSGQALADEHVSERLLLTY
jgi:DNA adenine methylase